MNIMSDWLSRHVGIEPWVASLIAIAGITMVLNQLAQVLLRQAARWTASTATAWDEAVVTTARWPILVAMWVVGLSYMARVLQRHVENLSWPRCRPCAMWR
jgi:hypothetical protein